MASPLSPAEPPHRLVPPDLVPLNIAPIPIRARRGRRAPVAADDGAPPQAARPRPRAQGCFAKYLANASLPLYAMFGPLHTMCQAQPAIRHALQHYIAQLNAVTWDVDHNPDDLRHSVMQSMHYTCLGDIMSVRTSPRCHVTPANALDSVPVACPCNRGPGH